MLEVKAFGVICIISDDILVGVCVFCGDASILNCAIQGNDFEIIGRKLFEAVVYHVIANGIAVILLFLDGLMQNQVEFLNDFDDTVGFNLISSDCATALEYIDLTGIAGKDFTIAVLAASLRKKSKMAKILQCEPEFSVKRLISHQRSLVGNTLHVDGVQNVYKSSANRFFHEKLYSPF